MTATEHSQTLTWLLPVRMSGQVKLLLERTGLVTVLDREEKIKDTYMSDKPETTMYKKIR